jgi:hypothetical protein
MAKEAHELELEFIDTIKEKTGDTLDGWTRTIQATGMAKPKEITDWLKGEHKLNHMQATLLAGIYLNDGKPVYDYDVMFKKLFEGMEDQQTLYQSLEKRILTDIKGSVYFIPTKAYVSIEGERVFGCAKIGKSYIRVGLDLGDEPFGAYVQAAKGLGAMPNISHMIEISAPDDVNNDLMDYVQQAYDRRHQ